MVRNIHGNNASQTSPNARNLSGKRFVWSPLFPASRERMQSVARPIPQEILGFGLSHFEAALITVVIGSTHIVAAMVAVVSFAPSPRKASHDVRTVRQVSGPI
jgi:hypothetical protein